MNHSFTNNIHSNDVIIKKILLGSDGQFKCKLSNGEVLTITTSISDIHDHDSLMKSLKSKIIEKKQHESHKMLIKNELNKIPKGKRNTILYHMVRRKLYYYLIEDEIECCSVGKNGNIIVTKEGKVFEALSSHNYELRIIPFFITNKMKVISVSVGTYHTALINDKNEIYISDTSDNKNFVKVEHSIEEKFTSVYAGENFTVVLTSNGNIYTFGANNNHQLGHSFDKEVSYVPQKVIFDKNIKIKDISLSIDHMMILSDHGDVYIWKYWKTFSYMGESSNHVIELNHLDIFNEKVVYITSSVEKYAAIDVNGHLYLWGKLNNSNRILYTPLKIDQMKFNSFNFFEKSTIFETYEGNFIRIKNDFIYDTLTFNNRLEISNVSKVVCGKLKDMFFIVNEDEKLAYHYCINNNLEELKNLIDHNQSILQYQSPFGNTLIHAASLKGNCEILKYLIEKDENMLKILNNEDISALVYSTKSNCLKCVEYIFSVIPNWSSEIKKCLEIASMDLNIPMIKRLLVESLTTEHMQLIYNFMNKVSQNVLDLSQKYKIDSILQLLHDFGFKKVMNNKLNYYNKRKVEFIYSSLDIADKFRIENLLRYNLIETSETRWKISTVNEDAEAFIFYITPNSLKLDIIQYMYRLRLQKKIVFVVITEKEKLETYIPHLKDVLTRVTFIKHEYVGNHRIIDLEWIDEFCRDIHSTIERAESIPFKKDIKNVKDIFGSSNSSNISKYNRNMLSNIINIYVSSHYEDMDEELKIIKDRIHSFIYDEYKGKDYIINFHHYSHINIENIKLEKRLKLMEDSYPFIISLIGERYGHFDVICSTYEIQDEITKLCESVYPWLEDFRNRSIIDIETYYSLLLAEKNKDMGLYPLIFIRDPSFIKSLNNRSLFKRYESETYHNREMVQNIKNNIINHPYIKHMIYERENFENVLKDNIMKVLDCYNELRSPLKIFGPIFSYQNEVLEQYRNEYYVPDINIMKEIQINLASKSRFAINGPIASGKSSLLTYIYDQLSKYNEDKFIFIHYIEKDDNAVTLFEDFIAHFYFFIENEKERVISMKIIAEDEITKYIVSNMIILIDNFDKFGEMRNEILNNFKCDLIVTQSSDSNLIPAKIYIHSISNQAKKKLIERNQNIHKEAHRTLLELNGRMFKFSLKLHEKFENESIYINSFQDIFNAVVTLTVKTSENQKKENVLGLLNLLKSHNELSQFEIISNLHIGYEELDILIDQLDLLIDMKKGKYSLKNDFQYNVVTI